MRVGIVLAAWGALQSAWSVWRIRTHAPDKNRVSRIMLVMHDITRTQPRPRSKLASAIESYSYWYGLVCGLLIFTVGLAFIFPE